MPPGWRVTPEYSVFHVFQAVPSSVRAARVWIGHQMRSLGLDLEMSAQVQLLVSELATNAIRHVDGALFQVELMAGGGVLEVSVEDDDPARLPRLCHPGPSEDHGRGLAIVDAVADAWGIRGTATAKVIWFQVGLPTPNR